MALFLFDNFDIIAKFVVVVFIIIGEWFWNFRFLVRIFLRMPTAYITIIIEITIAGAHVGFSVVFQFSM